MPAKVLVGGFLGLLTGVFFGEKVMFLEPFGRAYVLLIQAVVYPYIMASLLHGMGSMSPSTSGRLLRRGLPVYLVLWGMTFCVLIILTLGLPETVQLVFYPPHDDIASIDTLLGLLIPSDPFQALSENHMPAIVIFCLIFGAAFQHIEQKSELLAMLESVRKASLQFWRWIAALVPYAVFALFAVSAGTVSVQALPQIALYLGLLTLGCLALALWILPMILVAVAPVAYREVLGDMKEAITIAVATSITAAAIPYVIEITRKLADRANVVDEQRDDVIATNVSIGYAIGAVGSLFLYLFILFAASYFGSNLSLFQNITLPLVVLLSSVGSAIAALGFIGDWLNLPPDTLALYIEISILSRYPRIVLSIIALAFISIGVTLNYYGKLKIKPFKFAAFVAPSLVVLAAGAWGMGWADRIIITDAAITYLDLELDTQNTNLAHASYEAIDSKSYEEFSHGSSSDTFVRIQTTGALRVGINDNTIPFSYRNRQGDIVGYDIAFAHELASALDVDLVLVPFEWGNLENDLIAGRIDIAMSGLIVTEQRLRELIATDAYLNSPPALFGPPDVVADLTSREAIAATPGLTLGIFDDAVLIAGLKRRLPDIDVKIVPPYSGLPDFTSIDAAVWSLAQAKAIVQSYEGIAAVAPEQMGEPYVFVYYMSPESRRLRIFANNLIRELKNVGWHDLQSHYWLSGHGGKVEQERWSILSDVLGWDD